MCVEVREELITNPRPAKNTEGEYKIYKTKNDTKPVGEAHSHLALHATPRASVPHSTTLHNTASPGTLDTRHHSRWCPLPVTYFLLERIIRGLDKLNWLWSLFFCHLCPVPKSRKKLID